MPQLLSTMSETTLGPQFKVVLEALDPDTGDPVAGVVITSASLYADTPDPVPETPKPDTAQPLWLRLPANAVE